MRLRSQHVNDGVRAVEPRVVLLALATAALVVCDLTRFTLASGIAGAALAAFVALYYIRGATRVGIYAFIIAELSPVGLNADLFVALAYQAFALLLLTAVIVPFPVMQKARTYARASLVTLLIAVVALIPAGILVVTGTNVITIVQATSLATVIVAALGGTLIAISRNYRTLTGV